MSSSSLILPPAASLDTEIARISRTLHRADRLLPPGVQDFKSLPAGELAARRVLIVSAERYLALLRSCAELQEAQDTYLGDLQALGWHENDAPGPEQPDAP